MKTIATMKEAIKKHSVGLLIERRGFVSEILTLRLTKHQNAISESTHLKHYY